jgi:ParB/RepB/Spo0J family partition protein
MAKSGAGATKVRGVPEIDGSDESGESSVQEYSTRNTGGFEKAIERAEKDSRDANGVGGKTIGRSAVEHIPVEWIRSSDLNPRKLFDEDGIAELAASLIEHGQLQPIVVRSIPGVNGTDAPPFFEILAGERRWRAAKAADMERIEAIVRDRDTADDGKAVELALIENLHRRDINAMEEAQGFAQLQALGYSQSDIARKVGREQETISNRIRLLKLPKVVQDLIAAGDLSPSHGRELLRFEAFPDALEMMAKFAVSEGATVKALAEPLPFQRQLENAGLVRRFGYQTAFDRSVCQTCEWSAFRIAAGASTCLKPSHFDELQEAAKAEAELLAEESRKAFMERARRDEEARAQAIVDRAMDPMETDESDSAISAEAAGVAEQLDAGPLRLSALNHAQVRQIHGERPRGCTEGCECSCKALDHSGRAVDVCLDPVRFDRLTKEDDKRLKQEAAARVADYRERILESLGPTTTSRALAVALQQQLCGYGPDSEQMKRLQAALKLFDDEAIPRGVGEALKKARTNVERMQALSAIEPWALVKLAAIIELDTDLRGHLSNPKYTKPQVTEWLLGILPEIREKGWPIHSLVDEQMIIGETVRPEKPAKESKPPKGADEPGWQAGMQSKMHDQAREISRQAATVQELVRELAEVRKAAKGAGATPPTSPAAPVEPVITMACEKNDHTACLRSDCSCLCHKTRTCPACGCHVKDCMCREVHKRTETPAASAPAESGEEVPAVPTSLRQTFTGGNVVLYDTKTFGAVSVGPDYLVLRPHPYSDLDRAITIRDVKPDGTLPDGTRITVIPQPDGTLADGTRITVTEQPAAPSVVPMAAEARVELGDWDIQPGMLIASRKTPELQYTVKQALPEGFWLLHAWDGEELEGTTEGILAQYVPVADGAE